MMSDMMSDRNTPAKHGQIHWVKLLVTFAGLIALSLGFSYLLHSLVGRFEIPIADLGWLAYLAIFGLTLVANLTIIVPVPFALGFMIAAATEFNPFLIALFGSIGGSLGEMTSYYAGYLGRKLAHPYHIMGWARMEAWVKKYGPWSIFVLAVQPVVPFDIGALIAGATRMPLKGFFPALLAGRFIKYLALVYAGISLFIFGWFRWVVVGIIVAAAAAVIYFQTRKARQSTSPGRDSL